MLGAGGRALPGRNAWEHGAQARAAARHRGRDPRVEQFALEIGGTLLYLALALVFWFALGTLLAAPLIAYGILRTHLFDIDLRIRWTIKQSTLAAAVVTIIYTLSEDADRFLSSELGSFVGLLAAAVAEARQGGGISQKERVLLARLRDSLGISTVDAETLERELQARDGVRES